MTDFNEGLPYGLSYGWPEPEPEEDESLWLRFEANDILPVRVTSAKLIKYWGHWFPLVRAYRLCPARRDRSGRVLHANGCALCPKPAAQLPGGKPIASPGRLRLILTVEIADGRGGYVQRIWEFSDTVGKQLQAIQEATGAELRGLRLELKRVPPKPNGAVVVAADLEPADWGELPEPLEAAPYIAEGWRRAALRDGKSPPTLPF